MNTDLEAVQFHNFTAEVDRRFEKIAIADCGNTVGCVWLDEEQAMMLRDWLNRLLEERS